MRLVLVSALAAVPSLVLAEPVLREPRAAVPGDLVAARAAAGDDGVVLVRQLLPAGDSVALAQSRLVYLNRTGVTVTPGANDSRVNRSSIVNQARTIPAWDTTKWDATKACLRDMFSRFAVTFTDQDPGNVFHIEAVFGGAPGDLGMPSNVGGVSPFTTNCSVIEGSMVFAFTKVLPDNAQRVCEVMAQEIAHSYGLDHELLASDPMTYLSYSGARTFKDQLVSCGESQPRACGIGGSVCREGQNSVALLRERLGVPDAIAPMVTITAPADGATVSQGFSVSATASDNLGVRSATLLIDGGAAATQTGPGPYTFSTAGANIAAGAHIIELEVTDGQNTERAEIAVLVHGNPPGTDDDGDGGFAGMPGLGCSASLTAPGGDLGDVGNFGGVILGLWGARLGIALSRRRQQRRPARCLI